jgi:hypothetical protein
VYYAAGDDVVKAWIADLVTADRRGAAYGLYATAAVALTIVAVSPSLRAAIRGGPGSDRGQAAP